MRKLLHRTETYLALIIIVFCIIVQARSGQFFTANNLVDLVVSMIVPTIFCMGMLMVMITGGIDVSFTAIASLAIFVGTDILLKMNYQGSVLLAFVLVIILATAMGAVNGLLIAVINLPPLIVTLGTMSIFNGFLMGVLNASAQNTLPKGMNDFGTASLFKATNKTLNMSSSMPYSIFILIAVIIITYLILKYTMLGRGIYAVGGNVNAAIKTGFRVKRIRFIVYCYLGALAGVGAVIRICAIRYNPPGNMIGMEMNVIAAVVLGGTSLSGGKGGVVGAILGIGLITIMENSLLLLGISSYWQTLFTGLVIVIGTAVTSYRASRTGK